VEGRAFDLGGRLGPTGCNGLDGVAASDGSRDRAALEIGLVAIPGLLGAQSGVRLD